MKWKGFGVQYFVGDALLIQPMSINPMRVAIATAWGLFKASSFCMVL
jgi:hypothetical protein